MSKSQDTLLGAPRGLLLEALKLVDYGMYEACTHIVRTPYKSLTVLDASWYEHAFAQWLVGKGYAVLHLPLCTGVYNPAKETGNVASATHYLTALCMAVVKIGGKDGK